MAWADSDVERIAREFHQTYETLAPAYDYETRDASRVPWEDVPENNRRLMLNVVRALLADEHIHA